MPKHVYYTVTAEISVAVELEEGQVADQSGVDDHLPNLQTELEELPSVANVVRLEQIGDVTSD